MLLRCLDEVEKFLTNQIVQGVLQPKVPTNTFGCLALVDPDFVELNG
jgi:hypothetical protein